jgi:PAS domain S-box-containing protein
VDAPRNKLRPDRPTIEALEIFSSQAALIIESQLKIRAMRAKVEKIQGELELAQATANKAQKHLPALLHKDLEQTLFIHHLSQRARRITAGLDIAEIVSKQPARSEVLTVLGRETLRRMDFDTVLVAEPTPGGLSLTQILGAIPGDINPKALLGQRNPLRQCLQTGEVLLVSDVSEDEEWQSAPLLRALDTRSFLCLPINEISDGQVKSNGRPARLEAGQGAGNAVAAMLAVSRTPVAPFNDDDEQLYNLLTRQVSIALQNLKLLEDTHHRLKEVNLLLDFSLRLGSLDPASILRALLENAMSAVSNAKGAMVALWDDRQGLLIPQAVSGYANDGELMQVCYQPGEGLPGQVFEQKRALRLDEMNFARHYNLRSENLLHYRNATGGHLPVSGLAVPILAWLSQQDLRTGLKPQDETDLYRDEKQASPLGVLVLDNAQTTAAFTEDDLAVVASLAQQTALMLENARLYQASKQHSVQLQALTEVSTAITSNLKKEELIATLLDRLQAVIPFDTGTLWLRQKEGAPRTKQSAVDRMVVHAAHGFEDSDQRVGLAVDIQDSELLKEMIQTGRPLWVANIQQDARFRALSMMEDFTAEAQNAPASTAPGPERLSWLGVPLVSAAQVIGVIALEKAEPNFYSQDDIQVISAFAGQAAIGLENAELYQESVDRALELDKRSQTLAILNRLSSELSSSLDANTILDYAVREFMQIMPCTSVSALMIDSGVDELEVSGGYYPTDEAISRVILQTEYPPTGLDETSPYRPGSILPNTPLLTRLLETQGIFNTENIEQEPELAPLEAFLRRYSTYSLLIVPIISGSAAGDEAFVTRRRFHGLLLAHNSQPYRFSMGEIELARTISNQVAIALQNALLFEETRKLTADLEIRVQQRTSELEREHQRSETLLRIITELSASLDLDQVLHRTLHVLSEFVDAEQITILIARPGEEKLYRLASIGYTLPPAEEGAPTSLDIDQGLAGWIITQRQSVLVDDVREDDRWIKLAYPQAKDRPAFEHRSAIGVPLMSGAEALGCLLLYHPAVSHFSIDQLDLVQAAANQVAIAVNNAELYRLIRDQAEDLGSMLRTQQIETSRSKAILEAVADGVLVTDAKKLITLFNESAEKILGLSRTQLLGKSMEHFSGLFGRATRSWIEKIETWSQDPTTYQPGSTYIEQILLEDGRVISVHLSPVILRNDFLGTVSIFQDITHQVEVNRLKSEFVATVSHELRTPMTSIKGYVDILLMGAAGALNDQQRRFLQVVKENSERLTILVNDLLDISQIEAGRLRLSIQPLNLEELVAQAVTELKQRIQGNEKQATIQIVSQPNLPRVLGDPERIRRILDNLLDNAYQYNLQNGQITVKMQPVGSGVQVDIKDTGVGIHPGDQSQVFERFFRGENPLVLGVSGTGLGLAIVQNLVQMQNGRIWVESAGIPGEGSTFSFTLPIYIPENG